MSIATNPVFPVVAARRVAPDVVLQPGTLVEAEVVKVLDAGRVQIAIANLFLEVLSEIPLEPGQVLQFAVSQTPQGLQLQAVPQGEGDASSPGNASLKPSIVTDANHISAPRLDALTNAAAAGRTLTNLEALAVSAAVQAAAAKQGGLSSLFANLNVAATAQSLPKTLQEAAAQLLALRPPLDASLTGDAVKAAFEKSGLFLEQSLSLSKDPSVLQARTGSAPDLKAALIVFRQTLATWLGNASATVSQSANLSTSVSAAQTQQDASSIIAPSLAPHLGVEEILLPNVLLPNAEGSPGLNPKAQILSPSAIAIREAAAHAGVISLQEILQSFPKGVRDAVNALLEADALHDPQAGAHDAGHDETAVHTNVPPPPFRGSAPSAQAVASPSIEGDTSPVALGHHLLEDTDAALARQTLLQVASIPDRIDISARVDASTPRWNFEIPFATPQGTAVAQFEISRDGGQAVEGDAAKRVWRARFSLNVEPSGPIHALVSLSDARTSVRMWAERPTTAAQLRANAPQLSHALREAALEPGDIVIGDGAPPQPSTPRAGHFLDRAL